MRVERTWIVFIFKFLLFSVRQFVVEYTYSRMDTSPVNLESASIFGTICKVLEVTEISWLGSRYVLIALLLSQELGEKFANAIKINVKKKIMILDLTPEEFFF